MYKSHYYYIEIQVQIIAFHSPHFFVNCVEQNLFIRLLMFSNEISIIWIMLNLSDLCSFLVLILANVRLKNSNSSTFAKELRRTTTVINLMTVAQFFKAICTSIFKCLLKTGPTGERLFEPVLIYYKMVETNGQEILHLHFFMAARRL